MKFVLLALMVLTGTGAAFFVPSLKKNPATFQETKTETLTVKSASLTGNVADDRLTVSNKLVSLQKTVLKVTTDGSRVLDLNTEVTYGSVMRLVNELRRLNAASSDPIYLRIDSPGGSVLDGALLASEMEASKAPIYTVCTRLCASMAAMLHSYGTKRYVSDRAILMYHPASGGAQGQIPNMLSQLTTINRYIEKMVANVVSRSKVSKEEYEKLVAYELWIDAEDSVAKGLSDAIINLNTPTATQQGPSPDDSQESRKNSNFTLPFNIQLISPHLELWERGNVRKD